DPAARNLLRDPAGHAPDDRAAEDETDRGQRDPAPRPRHLHQLVELLRRRELVQRDLAEHLLLRRHRSTIRVAAADPATSARAGPRSVVLAVLIGCLPS